MKKYIIINKDGSFTVSDKPGRNIKSFEKAESLYAFSNKGKTFIVKRSSDITLNDLIYWSKNYGLRLSDNARLSMLNLFTPRCREKTVTRLRSILQYSFSSLESYGIYGRVIYDPASDSFEYQGGQSYPNEIRTVRECLLGKI